MPFDIINNLPPTSGVDFINVLRTAFTPVAPQSVRTQSSCLFMLLGATCINPVRRTLRKLTPGADAINISGLLNPKKLGNFKN